MNEIDLSYIAGALDCDGSISISVSKARYKKADGSDGEIQFQFTINIRQDERGKQLVYFAREVLGVGKIHEATGKYKMYTWMPTNHKDTIYVLNILKPYLHIKHIEAEMMLEALDLWLNTPRIPPPSNIGGRPRVPAEVKNKILAISSLMNPSQQKETSRRNKEIRDLLPEIQG